MSQALLKGRLGLPEMYSKQFFFILQRTFNTQNYFCGIKYLIAKFSTWQILQFKPVNSDKKIGASFKSPKWGRISREN